MVDTQAPVQPTTVPPSGSAPAGARVRVYLKTILFPTPSNDPKSLQENVYATVSLLQTLQQSSLQQIYIPKPLELIVQSTQEKLLNQRPPVVFTNRLESETEQKGKVYFSDLIVIVYRTAQWVTTSLRTEKTKGLLSMSEFELLERTVERLRNNSERPEEETLSTDTQIRANLQTAINELLDAIFGYLADQAKEPAGASTTLMVLGGLKESIKRDVLASWETTVGAFAGVKGFAHLFEQSPENQPFVAQTNPPASAFEAKQVLNLFVKSVKELLNSTYQVKGKKATELLSESERATINGTDLLFANVGDELDTAVEMGEILTKSAADDQKIHAFLRFFHDQDVIKKLRGDLVQAVAAAAPEVADSGGEATPEEPIQEPEPVVFITIADALQLLTPKLSAALFVDLGLAQRFPQPIHAFQLRAQLTDDIIVVLDLPGTVRLAQLVLKPGADPSPLFDKQTGMLLGGPVFAEWMDFALPILVADFKANITKLNFATLAEYITFISNSVLQQAQVFTEDEDNLKAFLSEDGLEAQAVLPLIEPLIAELNLGGFVGDPEQLSIWFDDLAPQQKLQLATRLLGLRSPLGGEVEKLRITNAALNNYLPLFPEFADIDPLHPPAELAPLFNELRQTFQNETNSLLSQINYDDLSKILTNPTYGRLYLLFELRKRLYRSYAIQLIIAGYRAQVEAQKIAKTTQDKEAFLDEIEHQLGATQAARIVQRTDSLQRLVKNPEGVIEALARADQNGGKLALAFGLDEPVTAEEHQFLIDSIKRYYALHTAEQVARQTQLSQPWLEAYDDEDMVYTGPRSQSYNTLLQYLNLADKVHPDQNTPGFVNQIHAGVRPDAYKAKYLEQGNRFTRGARNLLGIKSPEKKAQQYIDNLIAGAAAQGVNAVVPGLGTALQLASKGLEKVTGISTRKQIAGAVSFLSMALANAIRLMLSSWGGFVGGLLGGVFGGYMTAGLGPAGVFFGTATSTIAGAHIGNAFGNALGINGSGPAGLLGADLSIGNIADKLGLGTKTASAAGLETGIGKPLINFGAVGTVAPSAAVATTAVLTIVSQTVMSAAFLDPLDLTPQPTEESRYVSLTKEVTPSTMENSPTSATPSYTITITPKEGYTITVKSGADTFSYLGGPEKQAPTADPGNTRQAAIEAAIAAPIPPGETRTITYSIPSISGVDVFVNNSFAMTFDVTDTNGVAVATGEVLTATASIRIGNPKVGCFEFGGAGRTFTYSGGISSPTSEWTEPEKTRILKGFEKVANNSTFLSLVCGPNGDRPVTLYRIHGDEFGGWTVSPNGVVIYNKGIGNDAAAEYTLIHELGHIINNRNAGLMSDFKTIPGSSNCPGTYPATCGTSEPFAESIALYVIYDYYVFYKLGSTYDYRGRHPAQYNWVKAKIFNNETFDGTQ